MVFTQEKPIETFRNNAKKTANKSPSPKEKGWDEAFKLNNYL